MTVVKVKRKAAPPHEETIIVDYTQPRKGPWSPGKLYSRSPDGRRVLFLELMAWAIHNVETTDTQQEWEGFKAELVDTRKAVWGDRPWPQATDPERFLAHVAGIANVSTASSTPTGVAYPGRRTNPLAAEEVAS